MTDAASGVATDTPKEADADADDPYVLDHQVGYLLRLANQRHTVIFQQHVPDGLTPTQFSTLIRLWELGETSQNELGRAAAMDIATIKGVVDRLRVKNLVETRQSPADRRRQLVSLTPLGRTKIAAMERAGLRISAETLAPLDAAEQETLLRLLGRLI